MVGSWHASVTRCDLGQVHKRAAAGAYRASSLREQSAGWPFPRPFQQRLPSRQFLQCTTSFPTWIVDLAGRCPAKLRIVQISDAQKAGSRWASQPHVVSLPFWWSCLQGDAFKPDTPRPYSTHTWAAQKSPSCAVDAAALHHSGHMG